MRAQNENRRKKEKKNTENGNQRIWSSNLHSIRWLVGWLARSSSHDWLLSV